MTTNLTKARFMKELTVISGKGGTGKTSLVAAFASMAGNPIIADCDVDAADLHLILHPDVRMVHSFEGGSTAVIHPGLCNGCGECLELCRYEAINDEFQVDSLSCEGCGVCVDNCPVDAIYIEPSDGGRWFISETRFGPMVHAKLGVGQENSGKLVSLVRTRTKEIAEERRLDLAIVDGSPGIGCPVVSCVTGTDLVFAVSEPTQSGRYDLRRVLELARHFGLKTAVCVNKADLNRDVTAEIEAMCDKNGTVFVGTIPYDNSVTQAMVAGKALTEYDDGPAVRAVKTIWARTQKLLEET